MHFPGDPDKGHCTIGEHPIHTFLGVQAAAGGVLQAPLQLHSRQAPTHRLLQVRGQGQGAQVLHTEAGTTVPTCEGMKVHSTHVDKYTCTLQCVFDGPEAPGRRHVGSAVPAQRSPMFTFHVLAF